MHALPKVDTIDGSTAGIAALHRARPRPRRCGRKRDHRQRIALVRSVGHRAVTFNMPPAAPALHDGEAVVPLSPHCAAAASLCGVPQYPRAPRRLVSTFGSACICVIAARRARPESPARTVQEEREEGPEADVSALPSARLPAMTMQESQMSVR